MMNKHLKHFSVVILLIQPVISGPVFAQKTHLPPLPIEATGRVEVLPAQYPETSFLVHDHNFFQSRVFVIDSAKESLPLQFMGMFDMALTGGIATSLKRGEFYQAETYYSRGTQGIRTDVLTILDSQTLSPVAEIELIPGIRYVGMPERYSMQLMNDQRWLALANFSPAASVTLIDLDSRSIIAEIATPGCVLVYPNGSRGFSSLCADGRFMSTILSAEGEILAQKRMPVFFDSDETPIFERPAIIANMAYFPSFSGLMYPVDLTGEVAVVGEPWHLVPKTERAQKWAPGGLAIIDKDDLGRFYVLMHPDSKEGSHNSGGAEVWVYDPVKRQRVLRIPLKQWGVTLGVSSGERPLLMVTNPVDMSLEVYDTQTGQFIRTITDFGQKTPMMIHAVR